MSPTSGAEHFSRPSQHRLMLQDFYRTLSFRNALINHVQEGMTVCEIGTGTGILAYFAAVAGAKHVYTIEASDMVGKARELLAHNGVADRVTVLEGYSFDIALPEKADMLVTETLGHAGFDEGILELTHDARQRLLKDEALILPGNISLVGAPVFAPDFAAQRRFWHTKHYDYDVSPMEARAVAMSYVTRFHHDAYLSDRAALVHRTCGEAPRYPLEGEAEVTITRGQMMHGLAVTFHSMVSPIVLLDSRGAPSWQEVFLPIEEPFQVHVGETLRMGFKLERPTSAPVFRYRWYGEVRHDASRRFDVCVD